MQIIKMSGLFIVLSLLFVVSCSYDESDANDISVSQSEQSLRNNNNNTAMNIFKVRQDYRRCMYPFCGGVWVSKVNLKKTKCIDGTFNDECYVPEIDYKKLELNDNDLQKFKNKLIEGKAFVKGRIKNRNYDDFGNLGKFRVKQGWVAATDNASEDTLYYTWDSQIRCITTPCPTIYEQKVNKRWWQFLIDGINLNDVPDVTEELIAKGHNALYEDGIMISGYNVWEFDEFSYNIVLKASQFYFKVQPSIEEIDPLYCELDTDCTWSYHETLVSSEENCYCLMCPSTLTNEGTDTIRTDAWNNYCEDLLVGYRCPTVKCAAPLKMGCFENICKVVEDIIVE